MNLKKAAAKATLAGALGLAAGGFGTGLAQAEPFPPPPPYWAPPPPPPPYWAPWLPVEWNWELNAWGVWWNGGFQTL
jgi:hypothetical protein